MACLDLRASAPDTLNQLAGIGDVFGTVFNAIGSAGSWVASNSTAISNILDAAGRLKAQAALAKAQTQAAYDYNIKAPAMPAGMTPAQWQQMQTANVYSPVATQTTSPYLMPILLGGGALLLVVLLMNKRGSANG